MPALTQRDSGKSLEVHVGEVVVVSLQENPTTGYRWTVDKVDSELLELQSSDYTSASPGGVGGGGERRFTFKAKKAGTSPIQLKLRREWEGDATATNRFEVTVTVRN